ncbi:hypothetical protein LSUB1_G000492 [Lachnellula subtilissima]|uniref:Zn(2)-C6 fungal-type domain-containing protein n=1 Tax=Lachnellula subtilissima TaxID=602034 RepID=A0A8H8S389_9HELO|nr:hypothetical protein LSUB1_G000492 [Lachnellula subtilissima]
MEASTQAEAAHILKCSICAKKFENRKSYLRHGFYCRKAKTRARSRKKACVACTKAKTRCNLVYPECSRCVTKNITCGYGQTVPVGSLVTSTISSVQTEMPLHLQISPTLDSAETSMQLVSATTKPFTPSQDSMTDFVTVGPLENDVWNFEPVDNTSTYVENPMLEEDSTGELAISKFLRSIDSVSTFPNESQLTFLHSLPAALPGDGMELSPNLPNIEDWNNFGFDEIMPESIKLFSARKAPKRQLSLSRSYLLCTLRSYPHMIISRQSLPPFIHPYYGYGVSTSGNEIDTHQYGLAPLNNCAAIVKWYSAKNKDNIGFIWGTIRMEQERLLAEYSHYSDQDAVAALQAITVYFLLRISEDNERVTNFDIPLIYTMVEIAMKVKGVIRKYDNPSFRVTWEDWILAESLRRTMIVLFLIDLLFDIASPLHSYKCDGSLLRGLALPCGKALWMASTRDEWEAEYAVQRVKAYGKRQLTYGDLVNFHHREEGTLDPWLSQLDDFGTLVMTATSVQHWSEG